METPDSEAQLKAAQKRIQALEEANAKAEAASREAATREVVFAELGARGVPEALRPALLAHLQAENLIDHDDSGTVRYRGAGFPEPLEAGLDRYVAEHGWATKPAAAPPRATGGSADWDQIADMPTNAHALVGNTAE